MKRQRPGTPIVKPKKRRKYKYEYTPDMRNQPVPPHYLYDRLATDKQIEELMTQLELRRCIYDNLCPEHHLILQTISNAERSIMNEYIFGLIDQGMSRWEIEYEIEDYIEDIF